MTLANDPTHGLHAERWRQWQAHNAAVSRTDATRARTAMMMAFVAAAGWLTWQLLGL